MLVLNKIKIKKLIVILNILLASAFDYAKSLRVITRTLHKTTLATFYQASENIYEQFDRVLVLGMATCLFFFFFFFCNC
jgi:hypothetical protein